jgi:glycolate oxidase iron-sulfur subunit
MLSCATVTPDPVPFAPAPWFDGEDAPSLPDLHTCIHCGLCLTACPTYRELKSEPDSPRGRIFLMRGLAEGRIQPSDSLVGHLDLCLDCRACETVCPAGVPYSRMLEETRGQLSRRVRRGTPVRLLGEWALRTLFPHRSRMHLAGDLLRLGQSGPIAAFMRSKAAAILPGFARQGFAMTPPIPPRGERGIDRLARALPPGARMDDRGDAFVFHPAGAARGRYAFFTTCVMDVMLPATTREAVRLLVIAGAEVVVPKNQSCCGALHAHAGLRREAKALARGNVRRFEPLDVDAIVTHSAGCGAALRETGHLLHEDPDAVAAERFGARVLDVAEALDRLGLPAPPAALQSPADPSQPLRVGYHDPCHLAHAQKVRAAPRRLLAALPGVRLVDLQNSDWCCGSAGIYNLAQPEMADLQLERKLDSIAEVNPDVVVASNPGCMMHMARGARARGMRAPIQHLVEVLGRAYPPA